MTDHPTSIATLDEILAAGRAIAGRRATYLAGAGNTAPNLLGLNNSVTGTATARTMSGSSLASTLQKISYLSAATANASAGTRSNANMCWRGNAAGLGGFLYLARFHINATTGSLRLFVGLRGSDTSVIGDTTEPSALTNILGIGCDSTDANLQVLHNDGSGTATKTDLGASFDKSSTTAVYEMAIYAPSNGASVTIELRRLDTAASDNVVVSTDMPLSTSLLSTHMWINNGGTTVAVDLAVASQHLVTPY